MMQSWFKNAFFACFLVAPSLASDPLETIFQPFPCYSKNPLWEDPDQETDTYGAFLDRFFEAEQLPAARPQTPDPMREAEEISLIYKTVSGPLDDIVSFGKDHKGSSQSQTVNSTDDLSYEDDSTDTQELNSQLKSRVNFLQETEKKLSVSLEGICDAFFNLERAHTLFCQNPHVKTLKYALKSSETYFDLVARFLQNTYPSQTFETQANDIYLALNKRALAFAKGETRIQTSPRNIHGDNQKYREKSIEQARANQTRSADFIYTQGLHSESIDEQERNLKHALTYSKSRPLSQYFIENKTACFWIYGHLYHGAQGGIPLRDDSQTWQSIDKIHLFQGRIMEFFYEIERALMNIAFASDLGIEDPCIELWRNSERDASFIENFFQTWDDTFITYLNHVLVEDTLSDFKDRKIPFFLASNKIILSSKDNISSDKGKNSLPAEEVSILNFSHDIDDEKITAHDYPVRRDSKEKSLTPFLNVHSPSQEFLARDAALHQNTVSSEENIHVNLFIQ